MIRKLFTFVENKCFNDNSDALMNHELLLPGHLINMYLKEKIEDSLLLIKNNIIKMYRYQKDKCINEIKNARFYAKQFERFAGSIGYNLFLF